MQLIGFGIIQGPQNVSVRQNKSLVKSGNNLLREGMHVDIIDLASANPKLRCSR